MPAPQPIRPANAAPSQRPGELKLCGLSAVRARFGRDSGSILRLYFDYETGRKIGVICKVLAAGKKIYRCVEPAELEKVAGTIHHGGIVAVVREVKPSRVGPGEAAAWARKRETVLVLDRIGNAHNLGAIARTAAVLDRAIKTAVILTALYLAIEIGSAFLPGGAVGRVLGGLR